MYSKSVSRDNKYVERQNSLYWPTTAQRKWRHFEKAREYSKSKNTYNAKIKGIKRLEAAFPNIRGIARGGGGAKVKV